MNNCAYRVISSSMPAEDAPRAIWIILTVSCCSVSPGLFRRLNFCTRSLERKNSMCGLIQLLKVMGNSSSCSVIASRSVWKR